MCKLCLVVNKLSGSEFRVKTIIDNCVLIILIKSFKLQTSQKTASQFNSLVATGLTVMRTAVVLHLCFETFTLLTFSTTRLQNYI